MELERLMVPAEDKYIFKFSYTGQELVAAKIFEFDHAVLRDCESEDATIADKLLALELIARRIEESQSASKSD